MPCNDEFRSFCKICDRLVTEYEEVCKEKKSLQLEIEFRLSHQNNDEDNIGADEDDYDDYESTLGIDEDYDENLDKENSVEKGEIEDVSKFMKSNVKIFEIDVKQHEEEKAPESVSKKKEVVITKFEKNKKGIDHEQYLQVDPNTWDDIFTKREIHWDMVYVSISHGVRYVEIFPVVGASHFFCILHFITIYSNCWQFAKWFF